MSMNNVKNYIENVKALMTTVDTNLETLKSSYVNTNRNFNEISTNGFSKSNLMKDLTDNVRVSQNISATPSLGTVNGFTAVESFPMDASYRKNNVAYIDNATGARVVGSTSVSNTVASDQATPDLTIRRWTSRTIFKFTAEQYGYDRCIYQIPVEALASNEALVDNGHKNTLANYPYPEEIIMTSQKSEKNFIHFINVQYMDSHYGHYNGRNYNLMIVKDRTQYGVLDSTGEKFKEYTSVYANDVESELAWYADGYLYIPVPDAKYGEELVNSLWDCRCIWRADAPTRKITLTHSVEENTPGVTESTISSTRRHWYSVCYGKDKFVTVAYNSNYFAYSLDSITWIESTISDTSRGWYSVCYGKDKFVAIGASDYFAYSSDGITWTESTMPAYRIWRSVCYGNDRFVVVASEYNLATYSLDGITWAQSTISETVRQWYCVCYGNGKFIAVIRGSNVFAYSLDAITWTESTIGSRHLQWWSVCYGNNKFVAVADGEYFPSSGAGSMASTYFAYSSDGITWSEGTISSTSRNWRSVCYGNNKFVAVAYSSNYFAYSSDGLTWIERTISDTSRDWYSICCGNGKFVTVAYNTNYYAYFSGQFSDFSSTSINVLNGRPSIGKLQVYDISTKRDSIYSNLTLSSTYNLMTNLGIISTDASSGTSSNINLLIPPDYSNPTMYNLYQTEEAAWNIAYIPTEFFKLDNTTYLGIRGSGTKLYCGLFDNLLHTKYPSSTSTSTYPLVDSAITLTGSYLVSYVYSHVNNVLTLITFTTTRKMQVTITYSTTDNTFTVTSSVLISLGDTVLSVQRLQGTLVALFCNTHVYTTNVDTSTTLVSSTSVSTAKYFVGHCDMVANTALTKFVSSSTDGLFTSTETSVTSSLTSSSDVVGKYSIGAISSKTSLCKLRETYAFDTEINSPPSGMRWNEGTIGANGNYWLSVCYGKDKFVAVSNPGYYSYSLDGITWTESTISATDRSWCSVCYGNDKFVTISWNSNYFAYSPDGITWTESTISSTSREWYSVCYGNDKFVAIVTNNSNYFAYSPDGITWTESTISSTSREWYSVCYGNDKFVAVAYGSTYYAYSSDGITWNESTISSASREWWSVCYGNDKFVAVARNSNYFAYSLDGITWNERTISSTSRTWTSVCYGNGKFVVVTQNTNYFAYSSDGITWNVSRMPNSRFWTSVCYGKDKFVAVAANRSTYFAYTDGIDY